MWGQVVGLCEHCNEPVGFINVKKFFDWILKKDSASWNQLFLSLFILSEQRIDNSEALPLVHLINRTY